MRKILVVFVAAIACIHDASTSELKASLSIEVRFKPRPVVINGSSKIFYELHLTNFVQSAVSLKCVSVLEKSSSTEIVKVCNEDLTKRLNVTSSDQHAVVYFEVEIPSQIQAFKHRVEYKDSTQQSKTIEGAEVMLQQDPLLILDPPLAGGPWAAVYEPSWERGHRRVFYAPDDQARVPGRFAIDFMKLDDQGRYATQNEDEIQNWFGYGIDVLAVADASVASVRSNIEESKTVSGNPKHTLDEGAGNYIALDLGNGLFAFYEHLKPHSILVKAGDRVSAGQKIASLGFTGDSTGPHLHFHVADHNSTLAAEGLPYHFRSFKVLGFYDNLNDFGKKPWKPNNNPDSIRKLEFPEPNTVLTFN